MSFDAQKIAKKIDVRTGEGILILVVVIAVVLIVIKAAGGIGKLLDAITNTLGITKPQVVTDATNVNIANNNTSANPNSPWSPLFFDNAPAGSSFLTSEATDAIAEQVYSAAGFGSTFGFNIDASIALAAIKQLPTQTALSYLVQRFNSLYSVDLYDWMSGEFRSDNNQIIMSQIINYVNSLPKYN